MNATPPYLPNFRKGCTLAVEQKKPLVCWVGCHDPAVEAAVPEGLHCWEATMEGIAAPAVMLFVFVATQSGGRLIWCRIFEGVPTAAAIRETLGLGATP